MSTLPELVTKMVAAGGRVATKHFRPHAADSAAGYSFGERVGGRGASAAAFLAVPPGLTPRSQEKSGGGKRGRGGKGGAPKEPARIIKVYRDDEYDYDVFKNEVKILTMLSSAGPNVSARYPHVLAVGAATSMGANYEVSIHPWIIMEHCGETIKNIIPRLVGNRALATNLARQLCAGISFIHNAGIIHCDINPANIAVRDNNVKLLDFGSATPVGTAFQQHPGTVVYQAPEIRCELGYDTKCDIWSAGVTIFEMFTGFVPFDYYGDFDIMYSVDDGMEDPDATNDAAETDGDDDPMSEDGPASDNESSSEEELPADLVAEAVEHLGIMYKVIAAPDPQPAGYEVQPVPVPIGLSELISLNIDSDLADIWYIVDIVAPLLKFDPAERPTADQILKN